MARQRNQKGARRKHRDHNNHRRVQARTQKMVSMNRFAFFCFILASCGAVIVTVLPQKQKLAAMQEELSIVQVQEREARDKRDFQTRKYKAIQEGVGYKEIEARDRLDLHKPGETVFRFPSSN